MSLNGFQRSRYLLIIEKIKEDIESGKLEPGKQLPSENLFAKRLGVSRTTLREALRILEEEGIVIRKHGIGTFIHKKPVFSSGIEELTSITDMIIREGKTPGTRLLFSSIVEPIEADKKELRLDDKESILLIKRIRTADGSPMVYCIDKIPAHFVPQGYDLEKESLFRFLEEEAEITISYATAVIETVGYHEEISTILECGKESPLLVLRQTHYGLDERPVLYSINFFRSDKFSFSVFRKRIKL